LVARLGHAAVAVAACRERRAATASRLIGVPVRVGNRICVAAGSVAMYWRKIATVGRSSGVMRFLRPLLRHEALCCIPRAAGREWR